MHLKIGDVRKTLIDDLGWEKEFYSSKSKRRKNCIYGRIFERF